MSFDSLGLSENLLRAIREKGYSEPTPIQQQAIPAVLKQQDLMAAAQTGTGKTAGFTLPILQLLAGGTPAKAGHVRALILTPTRELAAQVQDNIRTYGKHMHSKSAVIFGGVSINPQIALLRKGVDILVATPGRLLDLYNQRAIAFSQLEILVLDEADRMLDMGFIHDIKKILALLPAQRQSLLFSATFSDEIRALAKGLLNAPVEVDVAPRNTTTELVQQRIITCDKARKAELLSHLIKSSGWHQALVFSRTKHGSDKLVRLLERDKISAAAIHGNKSQNARTRALDDFKSGRVQILVATDIAARGIDIKELPQVVNFDLPNVPEDYVHRIGRTGRAGANGKAISLVCADEVAQLADIERLIKRKLPREEIEGFEAEHHVPETRLNDKPRQPQRAQQQNQRAQNQPGNQNRNSNSRRQRGQRQGQERTGEQRGNEQRRNEQRSANGQQQAQPRGGEQRGNEQRRAHGNNASQQRNPSQPRNNQSPSGNSEQRGNEQRRANGQQQAQPRTGEQRNGEQRRHKPRRDDPRRGGQRQEGVKAREQMQESHPRHQRLRSYSFGGDGPAQSRDLGDDNFRPRRDNIGNR